MTDYLIENSIKAIVFWAVGLLAVWGLVTLLGLNRTQSIPTVPTAHWQAVFLNNNQVYFGKLQDLNTGYVALTDVYYLQTASELTQSGTAGSNLNLIKLGGEVHGPEDEIYIPKSSVLFWENMKDNSRVVQTIISTQK
jgi:hypothetical protein